MKRVLSPAKVNLGLWILGKRPDRYHEIITLFHAIDLCDEITIREGPLDVQTSTGIPREENLVYKALLEFGRRTGNTPEVSVFIQKRIPEGSGLGGGSSNVATVLKAINEILEEPLDTEELMEIAGAVSSDAPFFFEGGTAVGRGRGEIIEKVEPLDLEITLVIPPVRSSTREVYSMVREEHLSSGDIDKVLEAVKEGNLDIVENKLGELACEIYPEIGEVVRFLRFLGLKPLVSGSGSAVFYIGKPSPELVRGATLRGWRVVETKSWLGV